MVATGVTDTGEERPLLGAHPTPVGPPISEEARDPARPISSRNASCHHKPRPRVFTREERLFCFGTNFKAGWFNRLYFPTLCKGRPQVILRYPSRSLSSRRLIAETEQEQVAFRLQHGAQAVKIARPVLIGKDVKQSAVDHVVESFCPFAKFQGVLH